MENKKREIEKFYEQILLDEKLKERIEEKAKKIVTEEDLRKLIREEIMPLMKKFKVNFSEEELLSYEKENLGKLSEENLNNVSGGVSIKPILGTSLLALTLMGVSATGQISSAMFNGDDDDNGGKPQSSFFGGFWGAVTSFLPGRQAQTPEQQLEALRSRFETAKNELPEICIKYIEENDILPKIFVIDDNGNLYEKVEIKDSNEFAISLWRKKGQTECQIPDEVTDYNGVRHTVDKICNIEGVEKITISPKVKNINIFGRVIKNLKTIDFSDANSSANITLDSFAFHGAEKLKTVKFPKKSGNITIGKCAFWKDKELEELNINAKTIKIEKTAFQDCEKLSKVNITGETVEIGENAFLGTKVTKLNVKARNFTCADDTGVLVNQERFENAAKKLPEAIKNSTKFNLDYCLIDKNGNLYEWHAQENSDKVSIDLLVKEGQTEFQIPDKVCDVYGKEFTVGKVGFDRYGSMKNIQKITVAPALNELELDNCCFYDSPNLKTVDLSGLDKVTIDPNAFTGSKNLTEFNINPSGTVKIGEYAFLKTAIKELTIPSYNVTCDDNIGVPWRGKDGNLHEIVYKNAPISTSINMDLEEKNSENHSSNRSDDDNDNDNDNANNIKLDNNEEQSYNMDNDNLNYSPQISISKKYLDLIENIKNKLDEQQQENYDTATRQRGAEVGTNGSSIFIFIRNNNNPSEVTITHVFTPSLSVFADFPKTIITGKTVSGQEEQQETVNVVNINLDNNADLAEEFNRKIRVANINYVACNKPNKLGFGGDPIDIAAKRLILVLEQIESLDELNETSKENVVNDINYLLSYFRSNGNNFYLEDAFKRYTGINNLELIERFFKML